MKMSIDMHAIEEYAQRAKIECEEVLKTVEELTERYPFLMLDLKVSMDEDKLRSMIKVQSVEGLNFKATVGE